MSRESEIQREVRQFLMERNIPLHTDASTPLDLDSLTVLILLDHLEKKFGTHFKAQDITSKTFETVESIAELVVRRS